MGDDGANTPGAEKFATSRTESENVRKILPINLNERTIQKVSADPPNLGWYDETILLIPLI